MHPKQSEWLEKAFGGEQFYTKSLGMLNISTGNIVVCDPLILYEDKPLSTRFPTGAFPVELAVLLIDDDDDAHGEPDERVAFARIVFSGEPVSYWRMAVWEGTDTNNLEDDEYIGYSVDAGTGCFMDKLACDKLRSMSDSDEEGFDAIWEEMEASYKDTRSWLLKDLDDGLNIAAFSSGFGDGVYPTYIGYDSEGKIARLTTDFGCLWDEDEDEEEDGGAI